MNRINVLSLFDGMSACQQALKNLGISNNYFASEIDKYGVKVTTGNFPDTDHLGDVKKVTAKTVLENIFLMVGGSPCQDLSIAGTQKGLSGERSGLFYEYSRILKEIKPKYFILENVASMSKENTAIISKEIGVQPIKINSALVSAQNRNRLYWTNIPGVKQPRDLKIFLKDVLDGGEALKVKSSCIPATIYKENINSIVKRKKEGLIVNDKLFGCKEVVDAGYASAGNLKAYTEFGKRQLVFSVGAIRGRGEPLKQTLESRKDDKSNCLTTVEKDNVLIIQRPHGYNSGGIKSIDGKTPSLTSNSWECNNFLITCDKSKTIRSSGRDSKDEWDSTDKSHYRKLTVTECERLQTFPTGYSKAVSNSQRYKMIGNSFTVKVIEHILSYIPEFGLTPDEEQETQITLF